MQGSVLSQVVLPIALISVMFGVGLSLTWDDFKRVPQNPRAVGVGFFGQMILLPVLGYVIATALGLSPLLGVGLMVLALSPGGATSNLFSYLARGDVALSVTLTACVSLLTPFTLPLILAVVMGAMGVEEQSVHLPLGKTIVTLFVITVIPVGLAMLVRKKKPSFADKAEKPVQILALTFLFLIIGGIVKQNWNELPTMFGEVGLGALLLNGLAMAAGYGLATVSKLEQGQKLTIGIEVGIQNGTTALFVTETLLQNPTMSMAPACYSLLMFITGGLFSLWGRRLARR